MVSTLHKLARTILDLLRTSNGSSLGRVPSLDYVVKWMRTWRLGTPRLLTLGALQYSRLINAAKFRHVVNQAVGFYIEA